MKYEIEFIIKRRESLAENKIKIKIEQLLLQYKHRNDIHELGKEQINEPHNFIPKSQSLDLRSSNKHFALQNLSIYYT